MPSSEVDLKQKVRKIPAHLMKADRPHRVPLSDAAIEILLALKGGETPDKREFVFASPTGRPLAEKALRRAFTESTLPSPSTGLRSTFRDWVGDDTEAAYWRTDALKKRHRW